MSRFTLIVAATLSLAAIGIVDNASAQADVTKDQLVGTWDAKFEIDTDKVKAMLKEQGVGEEQIDLAIAAFKGQFGRLSLSVTFNADGTSSSEMSGVGPGKKEKGTWEFLESKGNTVKIKAKSEGSPEKTVDLVFEDPDRFTMESEELKNAPIKEVVFERKKPEGDKPEGDEPETE